MNAVLALQGLEETGKGFEAPAITGMGSMVSYYSSCSTTCQAC
ncbi:class III lanthipeptide [Kitasatospora camelliae]|uniref:Class III lanthipeptide n=1 Tax=Kitasatospora camelliae TaxID=3156397 RepID=A0AAU8JML2_9ACTN